MIPCTVINLFFSLDTDTLLTPMDIIIMARGLLMPSPDISVVTDMDTVLTGKTSLWSWSDGAQVEG